MRSETVRFFCVSVYLCCLLAACSGDGGQAPPAEPADSGAAMVELAALPALPPGRSFHPARITAAVTATRHGGQAVDFSPATVTVAGVQAMFDTGPAETGFAIYEFPGSPADDIASAEFEVSNRDPGHLVYVAISNYTTGTWEYIGVRDQDSGLMAPTGGPGDYASPTGYTYVAVFAHDEGDFDLDFVRLTYANRYPVSGQVVDRAGAGIKDVLITTTLGGPGVETNATGHFTLAAIPDGSWHLMAGLHGWVFFDNPTEITVSGGPLSGVTFEGERNRSHYDPIEDLEPNDKWWEAPNQDPATPVEEFLSASDDMTDTYRYAITVPGNYHIRFEGVHSLLFPHVNLMTKEGDYIDDSEWVRSGVLYLPFTVAQTRVVIVGVTCAGGGGAYSLSIGTGPLNSISGTVKTGGSEIEYATVGLEAPGEITYVVAADFSAEYRSDFRQPAVYTVTADPLGEDPYNYLMSPQIVDITGGDATNVDFAGTAMFIGDFHEPNDTQGTAYEFATLPVTALDPANIGDADTEDWFKVTPGAGKWLVVHLKYGFGVNQYDLRTIYMHVQNHDGSMTWWPFNANDGLECRVGPCDGNAYYIKIYTWDNRMYGYDLLIEDYDGYKLEIGGLWGSFGIKYALVDVYNPQYNWMQQFWTEGSGLTEIPFLFKDGEQLDAEFIRYGVNCDRYTKSFTINGADEKYWFRVDEDESADSWEPNDNYGKLVDYPLDADATISSNSDPEDKYIFTPLSTDPLHVVLQTPASGMRFHANLYEHATNTWVSSHTWVDDGDFLMNTNGAIQQRLDISTAGGETSYHISIDESPGYMLSGKVLDAGNNPVKYAYVYDPVYDHVWNSGSPAIEDYELGPFAPGTYQIQVDCVNYLASPASPWEVTFTNADVVQNFQLNPNYTDIDEPDDNFGLAVPIASGAPVTLNLNNDTDTQDWRKFTAGPGLVNLSVTYNGWGEAIYLGLYDTDGSTQLATSGNFDPNYQRIDYYLPVNGTYYICAWGGGNEYILTANY